jgi:hypothetical protein
VWFVSDKKSCELEDIFKHKGISSLVLEMIRISAYGRERIKLVMSICTDRPEELVLFKMRVGNGN